MAKKKANSLDLKGDALAGYAASLGIEIDGFREADGSIRELDLRRRISMVERDSAEFHFGKLFAACIAAFGVCGIATWLAMHFLWHPY